MMVAHSTLHIYSTSSNITLAYNTGALAGMMFSIQVLSGIIIAMSYVAQEELSFATLDTRAGTLCAYDTQDEHRW